MPGLGLPFVLLGLQVALEGPRVLGYLDILVNICVQFLVWT